MGYYIDLEAIGLMQYKQLLKTQYLAPGRRAILEDIDGRFAFLQANGIKSAQQLLDAVKSKRKLSELAASSGIPETYLAILSREVRSHIKAPIQLSAFSVIGKETVEKLSLKGLKTAASFYDEVRTKESAVSLAIRAGVGEDEILMIARLVDLSRIRWVNHTFAQVLLTAGYFSAKQVADADYRQMHKKIKELNENNRLFNGNIGLNDMNICTEAAAILAHEIEFLADMSLR